ncbi:MAG TPA: hypothetical protein VMH40_22080 [Myxococcaceae bacterium]|nr:hypothetical protein [Myxococcaceae bacterium]
MGREARCSGRWPGGAGEVKVLLETDTLILRGALSRRLPRRAISRVRVVGDTLRLSADGEEIVLSLGAEAAARWLRALKTPPAPLARKLGVAPGTRVHVVGPLPDSAEIAEALREAVRVPASKAELVLAGVADEASTRRAAEAHGKAPASAALWVVYRKGKASPCGEGAVRVLLRGRGLVDTKVAAVSGELSASRYHRARRDAQR